MKNLVTVLYAVAIAALLTACGTMFGGADASVKIMPTRAADGALVGPNGMTLYTFAKDVKNSGMSECYDQCAINWPPLTVAPTTAPDGDFNLIIRADATRQVAFKGQPLYYFAKDVKAGDKLGDGMGGNWKLAKP